MFDRYESGERAVLVHINFTQEGEWEDLAEFEMLVSSAGVETLQVVTGSRQSPHPKYYVGEGKAQEIATTVHLTGAEIVILITPSLLPKNVTSKHCANVEFSTALVSSSISLLNEHEHTKVSYRSSWPNFDTFLLV